MVTQEPRWPPRGWGRTNWVPSGIVACLAPAAAQQRKSWEVREVPIQVVPIRDIPSIGRKACRWLGLHGTAEECQ